MTKGVRALGNFGVFFRAKNDLGQSLAIAQIDEDDSAKIAPGMDPACEFYLLPDVGRAKGVTMMSAIHGDSGRVSFWAGNVIAQVTPPEFA